MVSISWVDATVAPRVAGFIHVLDVLSDLIGPVVLCGQFRVASEYVESNEKARCYVSQVDRSEAKDGDTHMSVHDHFRDR